MRKTVEIAANKAATVARVLLPKLFRYRWMRNFAIQIAKRLALFDMVNFTNFSILMMSTQ